jgi:uncharacterized protein YdeI (YjbR/CyaY-like superfamily)
MRFRARIELHGKTATGIRVPPELVENLKSGKRLPVRVTINGHSYRSTVPPGFKDALDRDATASEFFDGLSRSSKQRVVLSIEGAKTAETRLRRITKAISELREGRA